MLLEFLQVSNKIVSKKGEIEVIRHLWKVITVVMMLSLIVGCANQGRTSGDNEKNNNSTEADNSDGTDDYPNDDIHWIIPFSAGSGADTFARTLIKATEKHIDANIVPENVEGGSTGVGTAQALSKPADGYTVFSHSTTLASNIAAANVGAADFPVDEDNIIGISRINADMKTLAVNTVSDIKDFDDFVKRAKENPGELKVGGVGKNSWSEIFVKKIMDGAGIDVDYVPYDGGSDVVSAVLGDNLDSMVITSSNINSDVESDDIRILADSLSERSDDYPDVPTFKELGLDEIDDDVLWRGVFGKKGIPEEKLEALNEAFSKAIKEDVWKDYMKKQHQLNKFQKSKEFTKTFKEEVDTSEDYLK